MDIMSGGAIHILVTVMKDGNTYRVCMGNHNVTSRGIEFLAVPTMQMIPCEDNSSQFYVSAEYMPFHPSYLHEARIRIQLVRVETPDMIEMTISSILYYQVNSRLTFTVRPSK